MPRDLSENQERFCQEYVRTGNATGAYQAAGYKTTSYESAAARASHTLKNVKVQARIAEIRRENESRNNIESDRVLKEVARLAFATIKDICTFDNNGVTLRSSEEISPDTIAAIAEVTIVSGSNGIIKKSIKMHDKNRALVQLMRYLGLDSDFNCAIATLKKYGLVVSQKEGKWTITEE